MIEYNKIEQLLLWGIWSYFKSPTCYSENSGHFTFLVLGVEQLSWLFLPLTSTNLSKLWMQMFFRQHAITVTRNIFKKDIRRLSNTDDKRNQIRWF